MQKQLTLIFGHFEEEHLGKDVFLVPYYLNKFMNCHVTIVYPQTDTNRSFPNKIKGVELMPVHLLGNEKSCFLYRQLPFYSYLRKNAKQIDYLMLFHHTLESEVLCILYKMYNPSGVFYNKLDVGMFSINAYRESSFWLKRFLHHIITRHYHRCVDLASCETTETFYAISHSPYPYYRYRGKLVMMQNGFDEELLQSLQIKELCFEEKENVMITVGRLGTLPKNTSMLLEALKKVDLKDWKFYLIGPMETDLKAEVEGFYRQFPNKREQVIFIGSVYDKKELWEYYNKAKVFVLTSKWESYGLVLNEAKRFRNYLVSTEVGAYSDLSECSKYGCFIPQDDSEALAAVLNEITIGNRNINVYTLDFDVASLSWENKVRPVADALLSIGKMKKI
ncbi:glycosyltransferase family 4 protein [uncultured Bacteroides sp.]|uniref:glycosyltransferase family 4 protein n=1 Tax=uncultured Bacteroides sp. TaxID=162156 RepID=UPI00258CFD45|nr:glycosyltransferase family 4 protein [uncultured Bacteroides sp.]